MSCERRQGKISKTDSRFATRKRHVGWLDVGELDWDDRENIGVSH